VFDASALELILRFSILLLPLLVLIVLFTLFYQRHSDVRNGVAQRAEPEGAAATLLHGTEPGSLANAGRIFALRQSLAEIDGVGAPAAALYLELGRAEMQAGNEVVALEALRSAAGLAARHRVARTHAQARIELAEAALRAGDPTTACEHWQLARTAFLEDGAREDGDKVDRRMRANGCPTDWVLTDF
jgi:tetratricopeptide (TPR) repeat protein